MLMKKKYLALPILILGMMLSACNQSSPKITGYSIDENNNVIVIYDNGKKENVGNLSDEDIASHVASITISQDGYFVINGIKTNLKVSFMSISVSEDGYYVIDGIKTTIKVEYTTITISSDGYYVIDGIKTTIKVSFESVEISEDGYYIINGIKTDIRATNVYTVKFNAGYSASVADQKIFEGHKVERPQLDRTGYKLDGWFCNGEEWRFNSDVVLNDMTLAAKWTPKKYTISFVNEKGTNPDNLEVTYDVAYTLPTVDDVAGYTFGGWYNGSTKYSDGTWKMDSDIILTAKWTANTYTVTLDPGEGSVSKTSQTITYGQNYTLPIPTNSYGVFNGWLLNDELVTDNQGNSLAPWSFVEDKTFTVSWEIKLYSESDLKKLSTYPNAVFKLMNDITITSQNWTPIGNNDHPFSGTFKGENHHIHNVSIDTSSITSINQFGFFGVIRGATIENLAVFNYSFTSENINRSYSVGAIFGSSINTIGPSYVSNCAAEGSMHIASQSSSKIINAGGIGGYASLTAFDKCISNVTISNAHYAGGIVGSVDMALVSNSYNQNDIAASSVAGGIVGVSSTTTNISNSKNRGAINGYDSAGGIIGLLSDISEITNCLNTGQITSTTDSTFFGAGGLVGSTYGTNGSGIEKIVIKRSYNTGNINSCHAGGLVGTTYAFSAEDCYSNGIINGSKFSAGLCGFVGGISVAVKQCLAAGTVQGNSVKSTLAGHSTGFSAQDCYYTYGVISSWLRTEGTYYNGSLFGSDLYLNNMYWTDATWDYHSESYPTLKIESFLNEMEDSWD